MIKKIIIITDYPFNKRDYDRFGVATLQKDGFEVEVWDITQALYKNFSVNETLPENMNFNRIYSFGNKTAIAEAISHLDEPYIAICIVPYTTSTFFLFHALSRKRIKYCVLQSASFPNPNDQIRFRRNTISRLIKRALSLHPSDIVRNVCRTLLIRYYMLFRINSAFVIILVGGEKSRDIKLYPVDDNTHFLWTHALDYDLYLEENKEGSQENLKGVVFLDEYYPFHPDFVNMGMESPILPEEYYPKMCAFFSRLEKEWNCKITIAAHPRSHYEYHPDYFEGRPIIKGETIRLVRESQFVITHMSTSLNLAVLYKKPLLFVTMDKLQTMDTGKFIPGIYIDRVASELHCTPINLDQFEDLSKDDLLHTDLAAYDEYQSNFIKKKGTPELPLWEIFSSFIKSSDINSE